LRLLLLLVIFDGSVVFWNTTGEGAASGVIPGVGE